MRIIQFLLTNQGRSLGVVRDEQVFNVTQRRPDVTSVWASVRAANTASSAASASGTWAIRPRVGSSPRPEAGTTNVPAGRFRCNLESVVSGFAPDTNRTRKGRRGCLTSCGFSRTSPSSVIPTPSFRWVSPKGDGGTMISPTILNRIGGGARSPFVSAPTRRVSPIRACTRRSVVAPSAISAGPVNTLAARGIKGFTGMLKHHAERAPLRRNVELEEIGNAALFLASPMSSAITGEILHVDCGYNIIGV